MHYDTCQVERLNKRKQKRKKKKTKKKKKRQKTKELESHLSKKSASIVSSCREEPKSCDNVSRICMKETNGMSVECILCDLGIKY